MAAIESMEAVLLTGGASRRMATDKASIEVDGMRLADRIAAALATRADQVTILGRDPLPGHAFLKDDAEFAGPLVALARFDPTHQLVFIASCDLALFDPSTIDDLAQRIGDHEAAIPSADCRLQPLCALYRKSAFQQLRAIKGETRLMRWVDRLDHVAVPAGELSKPQSVRNVNTPEELEAALREMGA